MPDKKTVTTTTTTKTVRPDSTVVEERTTTSRPGPHGPPLSTTYRASPELQNIERITSAPQVVANQPASPETLLVEKKIERKSQDENQS